MPSKKSNHHEAAFRRETTYASLSAGQSKITHNPVVFRISVSFGVEQKALTVEARASQPKSQAHASALESDA
jgi:hypothetical protein